MSITPAITSFAGQSLTFWREEDLSRLDFAIPVLLPANADPRGRFPAKPPAMGAIIKELEISEISYLSVTPKDTITFLNFLVGRLVVSASVRPNREGRLRINMNKRDGIKFADNYFRAKIMSNGIRVEHRGILLKSGNELRTMERENSSIASGKYAEAILSLKSKTALKEAATQAKAATSEQAIALMETVQQYIDVEYELEQAAARETPPFSYWALTPEPRPQTYRLYFRMTLDASDYSRLIDLKPGILGVGEPGNSELSVEVVNAEPSAGKSDIIVSVERQVGSDSIPESGQLFLDAMPTLKNVRSAVVEQLREGLSPNGWFNQVASETYAYPALNSVQVDIPESEYPPNPSQRQAIFKGAGTNDFVLVLGPPGTGKTTVILQWVQHFIKQGLRVLVTSQNNKAVDNVLERLAREESTECVRLGNENKVSDSVSHLLIDRFATAIQKKLVGRLDHFHQCIVDYVAYMEALQHACRLLSSPASAVLQKKRIENIAQLENSTRQERHAEIDYLESDRRASQANGQLTLIKSRVEGYREKSVINPIRWIRLPWLLLKSFSVRRAVEANLKKALTAKLAFDKHSSEAEILGKRLATIETEMQLIIEKVTRQIPSVPEAPLDELKVVVLSPDAVGENSALISEILSLVDLAKKILNITESWKTVIRNERQRSIYSILLNMVDVVGATCIGINTNIDFKEIPFDVVIVDESGQIQIQNLVVPLSRAPKAILVGDHKQLPPVVNDSILTELEARDQRIDLMKISWFEWLWNHAPEDRKVMLDTQFRCPAVISDFISMAFYDNKYHAGKGMEKKAPLFSFSSSPILFIDTSKMPSHRRFEQSRQNGERNEVMGNQLETDIVIAVLEKAIKELPSLATTGEIGVIVPYANHVKQLHRAMAKRKRSDSPLSHIVTPPRDLVASVDSYQGQERDLIILALSRSNAKGAVGFLADWRRLNVAMTRAKRQLIMIGDLSTLTKPPRSNQAPDVGFKKAMAILSDFVRERCQLDAATAWTNNPVRQ